MAVSIVPNLLNGANFSYWSHLVKRALSVKNKVPLFDGTITRPDEAADPVIYLAWELMI